MVASRFVFVSLVAASVADDEPDASGMLQAQRSVKKHQNSARHTQVWEEKASDMMCIPALAGDRAPIVGHFTAHGAEKSQEVRVGQIAPTNGKFCVESGTMSLLQRSFGFSNGEEVENALNAKSGDVDGTAAGKNVEDTTSGKDTVKSKPKFALEQLGPFRLKQPCTGPAAEEQSCVGFDSFQPDFEKRTYTVRDGALSGVFALDRTEPLNQEGQNYWLGASKVDWAYQLIDSDNLEESTSFEKFGGFVLHASADETKGGHALEIDNDATDPLMTMNFGEPFEISKAEWKACTDHLIGGPQDGAAKITIPSLLEKGALEYCWETNHKECERGCFMYHTKYGYQAFAVLDFAMHSLGPFPLVGRPDLIPEPTTRDEWIRDETSAATLQVSELEKLGSDFWLGAHEVDWIYQKTTKPVGKSFEDYGGFLLVDDAGIVTQALEIEVGAKKPEMTLQFEAPHHISEAEWNSCENPAKITIDALSNQGAQNYCWHVSPGKCVRGCFIYKTTNGFQGFAIKSYALESLGPFNLFDRLDLSGKVERQSAQSTYSINGEGSFKLGATLPLAGAAKDFWGAHEVDWAYQALPEEPDAPPFEAYGGFLLVDEMGEITKTLQIGDPGVNGAVKTEIFKTLNFGSPFHITEEKWNQCSNPHDITITFLSNQGAQQYCWEVDDKQCDFGCFLYKTTEGYQGFPVEH